MDALRTLWAMAWRNLWRHRRRSLITAAAMAVAAALSMMSIALTDGTYAEIFRVLVEERIGHVVVQHPDFPAGRRLHDTITSDDLAAVDGVEGIVVAAPRLYGHGLAGGVERSTGARLVGILPDREAAFARLDERVVAGSYLDPAPAGRVLVGEKLAQELGIEVGDELVLLSQAADGSLGNGLFTVVGLARTGDATLDRAGVWAHLHDLQEMLVLEGRLHEIAVLTDDVEAIDARAAAIDAAVDTPLVQTWWEAAPSARQMLDSSDASKVVLLGVVFLVAAFGVVNTMTMSVFERTRELGVLRAIGMRPGRLVLLVVFESLQLSLLAVLGALILGGLGDAWLVLRGIDFSSSLEEGFAFSGVMLDPVMRGEVRPGGVVLTLAAVLTVGVLSSLWPAWRASRMRPVDAIRTE